MNIALIDLGSNSARMFIMKYDTETGFTCLSKHRVMTRLSDEMKAAGFLSETPIQRTIAVLEDFADKIQRADASVLAIATAAVRKAKNGSKFCDLVKAKTGIRLNIISGELEAFFDFCGVMDGLPDVSDCLICDTGGGSTELILVKNRSILRKISLPIGAVNLTEKFFNKNDISAPRNAAVSIAAELEKTDFLNGVSGIPVVGLGGSTCAVVRTDKILLNGKSDEEIHGYTLSAERTGFLFETLYMKTPGERMELGIEKGRADTVCAGLLPTVVLMQTVKSPELILCKYGLREGILAELRKDNTEFYIQNPQSFIEKYINNK